MRRNLISRFVGLALAGMIFWRMPSALVVLPGQAHKLLSIQSQPTLPEKTLIDTEDSRQLFFPLVYGSPLPLGSLLDGWYLMLDDEHIASRDVPRIYHPYQKYPGNPIMVADRPYEGNAIQLFGTVLPGFKMWYGSYNKAWGLQQILYAESQDGLNWIKPNLDGNGSNALLGGMPAVNASLVHVPQDIQKPFKLMVYNNPAYHGFWSTAGIINYPYPENPLFQNGSDVAHFYWDPNLSKYGGTAKESTLLNGISRRSVRFLHSDDFINWVNHPTLLSPDSLDDLLNPETYVHLYGMPVFPMGEQYAGLLWVFTARDEAGLYGRVHVQLASSHDGVNWYREDGTRPPILELGPVGSWDGGQIYTSTQPIHIGHELWLYYSGCNLQHGGNLYSTVCSIGLAKAVFNRLVSLNGSGQVLTKNLEEDGSVLHLNYDARTGSLSVELLRDGVTIPGYEAETCDLLTGDSLDQVVSWAGNATLPEAPFQIRFHLQNTLLFAFLIQ